MVATINDSETGNDVIEGRQLTGSLPTLQTARLSLWMAGLRRAALHRSLADFELDDLFKEPKNRSMDAVIVHAQQLIFVDERIKKYFFSKAKEVLKRNQWDE